MKRNHFIQILSLSTGLLFASTVDAASHDHQHEEKPEQPILAVAVIQPTAGNETTGIVYFEKVDGGMKVSGTIRNLTPGKHGFHVHQYGDTRKPDGTSAGGHFNPTGQPHGGPEDIHRHTGDLGNIVADEDGVATFTYVDSDLTFTGSESILGRGLIVHAGADDLVSQPTGDAGARVGIAVIGVANPELK